ncbi:MAG TPA: winged helix-turn-helix domain-containing protein [Puia sp.]|nr:winged helix-turn-helix domain-containing protein [Puia sp.]
MNEHPIVPANPDSRQLVAAGLTLDPDTREVRREGRRIALEQREFQLLEYLLHHKNRIVPRDDIYRGVWGHEIPGHTLDARISSLRKKIEHDFSSKILYTISRKGYLLVDQ